MPADKLMKLYAKSDFESVDDSDMIRFSYGNRKIALRKKSNGECVFLSDKRQCSVYEARPMSCRIFPIDVLLGEDNEVIDLEMSDVVRDKFIKCKHYYGKPRSFETFKLQAIQCANETDAYWKKIKQWNRKTGKRGKLDFLNFFGFRTSQ